MDITEEMVRRVAGLASLALTEDEVVGYTQDLSKILGFVAQLDALPLAEVSPEMGFVGCGPITVSEKSHLRADQAERRFEREVLMAHAPDTDEGFFVVPKILEDTP
ncbi:MAG: Asp-tRNA(Asn)/Glu-tRNA(Gln) amidotransferase subunit GatC [Candidatus Melainabacteria bacterium]|nr:Asp-tRNA(Asn)/Glu-tRNA(Gln) amidotransferase subunit GatC [Candidatus Melainabacteria bacterium]